MTAKCRSCGAAIVWAESENGKRMPVDAEPSEGGNIRLLKDPTLIHTHAIVVRETDARPMREKLHRSHFATCPNAEHHRKG